MEKYKVSLERQERAELEAIVSKGRHAAAKVINALILLNCDAKVHGTSASDEDIAQVLQVSTRKVERIKKRFVEEGLQAALERQPSARVYEKKVDGELEAHLIALSCSPPPPGRAHWTLQLLADKAVELQYVDSIAPETVRRALKKTNSSRGARWVG